MAEKTNTIKNRIVVEGEKEYKASLSQARQANAELRSEMRATKAEFAGQEESVESLQAQLDILNRQYDVSRRECETLEEYLKKTEKAFGDNSKEASDLRIKLNNARAAMNNTGNELNSLRSRLGELEQASEDAGSAMGNAEKGFGQIGQGAQEATGEVETLIDKVLDLAGIDVGTLGLAGLAAGAAGAVKEGLQTANEQTQARNQMAAFTGKTGEELAVLEEVGKDVYRQGYGEDLKDASQGVATVNAYTGIMGDELQEATEYAFRMRDVFGHDIPESARTAQQMMAVFGISAQEAYGLMAAGAQEGADKNGNLLDTINEYAPYYEKAGKSAQEFIGTLTAGGENGIYDVDKIGDAMKEFTIRLTDGSETTKEALKTLGAEVVDLPGKFAMGGETASAAFDLIIDKLLAIEDPLTRSQTGIALFGTQWEDTGGAILQIFDAIGMSSADAQAALEAIDSGRYDDIAVGWDRLSRHVETAVGESLQPAAKVVANTLNYAADAMDVMEAEADAAEARAEAVNQTVGELRKSLDEQLQEVNQKIAAADLAGDYAESFRLSQERDAIIADIAALATDVAAEYEAVGTDAAAALESKGDAFREAGQNLSQETIDAMNGKQPDMLDAGMELGGAGSIGLEAGLGDGEDAGSNYGDAVASGIRSKTTAVRLAAMALGAAASSGTKLSMRIASPSKAGLEMGENYGGAVASGITNRERDVAAAGEVLGRAADAGVHQAGGFAAESVPASMGRQSAGVDEEATVRAFKRAMNGMAVQFDGRTAGRLLEEGVSVAEYDRAAATISGRSASRRI